MDVMDMMDKWGHEGYPRPSWSRIVEACVLRAEPSQVLGRSVSHPDDLENRPRHLHWYKVKNILVRAGQGGLQCASVDCHQR